MDNIVIKLNQNKVNLREKWEQVLTNKELEYRMNYLAKDIQVNQVYECFKIVNNTIKDSCNISITEITPCEADYIIKGIGMEDEEITLMLSETEFWTC